MVYVLREDNDETLRIFGDGDPHYDHYRVVMFNGETSVGYDTGHWNYPRFDDDDVTRTVDAGTLRDVGLSFHYRYASADPVHGLERIIGSRQDDIIDYMNDRSVATSDISISAGRGDDEIFVWGVDGSIDAGPGDDLIHIAYGDVSVDGGDGVDLVDVWTGWGAPFDPANLIRTGVSTWDYTHNYADETGVIYASHQQTLKNVEVLRVGYDEYIDLTAWSQTAFDDQLPPELATYEEITVDEEITFDYFEEVFEFDMVEMMAETGTFEGDGDVQAKVPQWAPAGTAPVAQPAGPVDGLVDGPVDGFMMGAMIDDMIWI